MSDPPAANLALYAEVASEISRLRETEQRLAFLGLALDVGLLSLVLSDNAQPLLDLWVKVIAGGLSTAAVAMLGGHLVSTHRYLTMHRQIRHDLEHQFGFHDDAAGDPILPKEWNRRPGLGFQAKSIVLPLLLVLGVAHAAALYVLVRTPADEPARACRSEQHTPIDERAEHRGRLHREPRSPLHWPVCR